MEKKIITCIECPMGCSMIACRDGNEIEISGNGCPRGKAYAQNEMICPRRIITSTVRAISGQMISVKTDKPVKKAEMFLVMQKINQINPKPPVKIGDILKENIIEDINLIATSNCK